VCDLASLIEQDAAGAADMIAKVAMLKRAGVADTLKSVGDTASKAWNDIGEAGRGAAMGGLGGAALGGVSGYALAQRDRRDRNPWASAMTGALAGGGLGAAIGAAPSLMGEAQGANTDKKLEDLVAKQKMENYAGAGTPQKLYENLTGNAPPGVNDTPSKLLAEALKKNDSEFLKNNMPDHLPITAGAAGIAGLHGASTQKARNVAEMFDAGNTKPHDPADIVGRVHPGAGADVSKYRSWPTVGAGSAAQGGIGSEPVASDLVKGRWFGGAYPKAPPSVMALKADALANGYHLQDPAGRELAALTASSHAARGRFTDAAASRGSWLADMLRKRNPNHTPYYSSLAPVMARGATATAGKLTSPLRAGLRNAGITAGGIEGLKFLFSTGKHMDAIDKGVKP